MPEQQDSRDALANDALALFGPVPVAIPLGVISGNAKVASGRYGWCGLSMCETAGGAADFTFYDGQDATGTELCRVKLAAGTSTLQRGNAPGVLCRNGIFVARTAGTADITIYAIPLNRIGPQ